MTIGERIKYFRTQKGITQANLAELSEIHPVSIRKYETNKMQPQPQQLEKIAEALDVNYGALVGISNMNIRLETEGDFMGLLMLLCSSGVLIVEGRRLDDFTLHDVEFTVQFNPLLNAFLELQYYSDEERDREDDVLYRSANYEPDYDEDDRYYKPLIKLPLEKAFFNIRSYITCKDFLKWEKMNFLYNNILKIINENPSEENLKKLADVVVIKEQIELELQSSTDKLSLLL